MNIGKDTLTLRWMGQMGLMIQSGETKICIDYYATPDPRRQVPPPIPADELKDVRAFLGSHNHLDHIDHESWKIWVRTCPKADFVFPEAHHLEILEDGIPEERAHGINDGGEVTFLEKK